MSKRKRLSHSHWRGATVVRGLGMKHARFEQLIDRHALDGFDERGDVWLVIEDRALEDLDGSVEVRAFLDEKNAIRCARALANGNVDQRVLRVTQQVLVVATENDL